MRNKFNMAYQQENESNGEIEKYIRLDVYIDCLNKDSFGYFKEGLISLCNGMSDYLISDKFKEKS